MSKIHHTTIIERKQVAQDTLEVSLKRPDGFSFQAGQYIQLCAQELLHSDPKGSSRVMSIVSSPLDQEKISVAFRQTETGFKRTFKELPIGAPVLVEGPHGFFTLPENLSQPVVLIAGGIGVTPYLSMIRYATEKRLKNPITLLYINRNKDSAAYLNELDNMTKENINLLHDIVRKNNNFTLKNKFGRIDDQFIQQSVKNIHDCIWYIAGPPAMVDFVKNILFVMGIENGRVCFEEFVGY